MCNTLQVMYIIGQKFITNVSRLHIFWLYCTMTDVSIVEFLLTAVHGQIESYFIGYMYITGQKFIIDVLHLHISWLYRTMM